MTNSFYNSSGTPGTAAPLNSSPVRTEFALIGAAFDLFPVLAGNGGKAVVVNGSGTALALTTGRLALGGNLTFLGTAATTFAAVAPVTLTLPSEGGVLLTTSGGTMTGVLNLVNGSSVPTAVAGTSNTQIASTAFVTGAVSSASSGDRAYADGKFLPLTGGNVNGGIDATGTLEGSQVQARSAVAATGFVRLEPGDATHTGRIRFLTPAGASAGYIGFGTTNRLNMTGNEGGYTGWDMTGSLNVTGNIVTSAAVSAINTIFLTASGANDAFYYADGGSGHYRGLMMRTSGANRWLVVAETTAEGGASVGSDFGIYRYLDGAPNTPIGVMNIKRDSGDVRFAGAVSVDTTQSGDDFQLWSTAVPPYARTISFTTTGWMLQFNGQLSDLNYWPDPAIGASSPQFTSQGTSGNFIVRGAVIGNNISAPSDERVKRDIEPYTRGLDDLIRLNPVIYSYNGLGGTTDDGTRRVGLGARASRDIVPECVFPTPRLSAPRWNRDGSVDEWVDPVLPDQLSLDDRPLLFAMINALKTLHERIQTLEGKQ